MKTELGHIHYTNKIWITKRNRHTFCIMFSFRALSVIQKPSASLRLWHNLKHYSPYPSEFGNG